jgi:hypothetical protein
MKRLIGLVCCVALFLSTTLAQKKPFISKPHNISASIPNGWDQIQGVRDNRVLKLARSGRAGQTARIAVVLDDIPKGRLAPDFDIWDMLMMIFAKLLKGVLCEAKPFSWLIRVEPPLMEFTLYGIRIEEKFPMVPARRCGSSLMRALENRSILQFDLLQLGTRIGLPPTKQSFLISFVPCA